MLSGATWRASEMAGTAVFRIVVSSDSIKNATATSHGNSRLLEADSADGIEGELAGSTGFVDMAWKHYFTNESDNLHGSAAPGPIVLRPPFLRGVHDLPCR